MLYENLYKTCYCSKCEAGFVYFAVINNSPLQIKIGKTKDLNRRIKELKKRYPDLYVPLALECCCSRGLEKFLHQHFINKRVETAVDGGSFEIFFLTKADLLSVKNKLKKYNNKEIIKHYDTH